MADIIKNNEAANKQHETDVNSEDATASTLKLDKASRESQNEWAVKYQRLAADFANYKKRVESEWTHLENKIRQKILKDLLVIYDDFARLNQHREQTNDLKQGISAVNQRWLNWIRDQDIEILHPLHKEFDYELHDAVLFQPVTDPDLDGKVVKVIENGYKQRGQILKHAKVAIGRYSGAAKNIVKGVD
ncbi:MAG: nucleotide exchange factor GrpE [bacterium]